MHTSQGLMWFPMQLLPKTMQCPLKGRRGKGQREGKGQRAVHIKNPKEVPYKISLTDNSHMSLNFMGKCENETLS